MSAMGLADYCHPIQQFDPDRIFAQVRHMASFPQPPVATIERRVTEYRMALAAQFDRLLELARSREG